MENNEKVFQEIAERFGGKWKEIRRENVDAFFREMGFGWFTRLFATRAKPDTLISVNAPGVSIVLKNSFRADGGLYKLNEETEIIVPYAGKLWSLLTYKDNKLTLKAHSTTPGSRFKPMEAVREINSVGEMETTFLVGDVVSKRVYSRVHK